MSPLSCHVHASLFSMRRARWLATFWHRGSSHAVPLSSIGARARSGRDAPQQDDGAGQTSSVRVPRQPKPNQGETQIRPNAIDSTNLTTAQLYQTQGLINLPRRMQASTPNRCHGADPELKCKMKPGALVAGDRALALAIAHQVPRWPAGPGPSRPQRGTH